MISGTQPGARRPEPNAATIEVEPDTNGNRPVGVLSLPNRITLCRIVATPVFLTLVVYRYYRTALALFILTTLSDALDGFLARTRHQRTRLGRILDPLADKFLLAAAFVVLTLEGLLPTWITIAVVSRDALIVLGTLLVFLATGQLASGPSKIGKATAAAQFLLIIAVLTFPKPARQPAFILTTIWIAAALTVASGLHYLYLGMRKLNDA